MLKYQVAEKHIRELVARGSLKPGGKVPSIRKLSRQLAISPITVQHAYEILTAAGVIAPLPRSGYYVTDQGSGVSAREPKLIGERAQSVSVADVTYAMLSQWHKQEPGGFGGINPHPQIFQTEEVHRFLRLTSRQSAALRVQPNPQEGNEHLRTLIAEKLVVRGLDVGVQDVVITNTGLQGFDLCLDMLTARGDTVLLDTPTYLPLVLSLQKRGLRVLEIYSHPTTGIDPGQLAYLLGNFRVKAAILSPLNHFPTGVSSSAETVAELARIIEMHEIPTIEFDLFSELSYKEQIRKPVMAHITSNKSLLFGNFLDVLGPNFNLGWVVGRQSTPQLMERKFLNNLLLGDELLQQTLADYVGSGQFDKNIRRLRRSLSARAEKGLRLLTQLLPRNFTFSKPTGGYMCWVRGPFGFDAISASTAALDLKLSLAPGPMFSPSDGFHNFFGINLSASWMEGDYGQLQELVDLSVQSKKKI